MNIPISEISLCGDSAGGHLCASLSTYRAINKLELPLSQCLIYPMTDPLCNSKSQVDFNSGFLLSQKAMIWFWQQLMDSSDNLNDPVFNLTIDPKSFESERQVVKEERKMRYENSPIGKLFLSMMQSTFKGSPYGGSVIGDVKDLDSLSQEQIQKFFKTFYSPNNAIVVVVGDVDAEKVFRQVKSKYGSLEENKDLDALKSSIDNLDAYDFCWIPRFPDFQVRKFLDFPFPRFPHGLRGAEGGRMGGRADSLTPPQ